MVSTRVGRRLAMVRAVHWTLDHWLLLFLSIFGVLNVLPFLAPVAMHLGWNSVGDLIYLLYAPLCHQMAQRSFFLFGSHFMVAPNQLPLQLDGSTGANMLVLKQFSGDASLGWKVAWSDRMVYMYGATWLAALLYAVRARQQRINPVPNWAFVVLLLPMAVDGGSHMISDFESGLFGGFRYTNAWLAQLTGNMLPSSFYTGDALGSFNAWMRLISGVSFGVAMGGFVLPVFDVSMKHNADLLRRKLEAFAERQRRDLVLPD